MFRPDRVIIVLIKIRKSRLIACIITVIIPRTEIRPEIYTLCSTLNIQHTGRPSGGSRRPKTDTTYSVYANTVRGFPY